MKQKDIIAAYGLLKNAKLSKMEGEDKYKAIRLAHEYRLVSEAYEAFRTDAVEKLKEDYPGYDDGLKKAVQWEKDKTGWTEDEYRKFMTETFSPYMKAVGECVRSEAEKDYEPKNAMLTEEAFGKLADSNPDWTVEQTLSLMDVLVKKEESK